MHKTNKANAISEKQVVSLYAKATSEIKIPNTIHM